MTNKVWKYTYTVGGGFNDQSWAQPGFNDSTWTNGIALFGRETTPLEYSPFLSGGTSGDLTTFIATTAQGGPETVYFRTHFTWSGATCVSLVASNLIDDGCVWYLNGVEVDRDRIAAGPVTPATTAANNGAEGVVEVRQWVVPFGGLKVGDNVVAVELHNTSSSSSDDVFGMALSAIAGSPLVNSSSLQPSNRTVLRNGVSILSCGITGVPTPVFQWLQDGVVIPGETSATLTITNQDLVQGVTHKFKCQAQSVCGALETREASILYTDDTIPPHVLRAVGSASQTTVQVDYDEFVDPSSGGDYINYDVSGPNGPLGVAAASMNPNGASVTLVLATAMEENTTYTVTINFVTDLAGNGLADNTQASFLSWVTSPCSGVLFEVYNGTSGATAAGTFTYTTIAGFVTDKSFPDTPSETLRIPSFDSRVATTAATGTPIGFDGDAHEHYGTRVIGLFIAPQTGGWRFALRTDDPGQLWFNPAGPSAAGRVKIAEETGCCGSLTLAVGDARLSAPQQLVAGQGYYIEGRQLEIGGGDYIQVAAIPDNVVGQTATNPIPVEWLGSVMPAGLLGTFTITRPPAGTNVIDGTPIGFSVGTSKDAPMCYQWLRDGAPIPGAIGPTFHMTATTADSNANFSVQITIPGGATLTSAAANLKVGPDTTPFLVLSVVPNTTGDQLTVTFNKPPVGGATAANYTLEDNTHPTTATVSGDVVVLQLAAAPATCVSHTLTITGITDNSSNPITPPNALSFQTPITLISSGATWRYNILNTDLGTSWKDKGYDDSAWPSGGAVLAWEPDNNTPAAWPIVTVLKNADGTGFTNQGYFRTHFNLPTAPSTVTSLLLTEVLDDGDLVYLNGVLVHSNRMVTPVVYGQITTAGSTEPHPVEGPFTVPTGALVSGDNVLAVEVHQSSATSSDLVFGAQLVAEVSACGVSLTITVVDATHVRLDWGDATYSVQSAALITGTYNTLIGVTSGSVVASTPGNKFFRLRKGP